MIRETQKRRNKKDRKKGAVRNKKKSKNRKDNANKLKKYTVWKMLQKFKQTERGKRENGRGK